MKAGNEFYEPLLRFRIASPKDWKFTRAVWSPAAQIRDPDQFDWRRYAPLPFVGLARTDATGAQLQQLVQVTADRLTGVGVVDDTFARIHLAGHITWMKLQNGGNVDIRTVSWTESVAGHRANKIVAEHTVYVPDKGFVHACRMLGRVYIIFAAGMAFTVTMVSTTDPRSYRESDFEEVLQSISIG